MEVVGVGARARKGVRLIDMELIGLPRLLYAKALEWRELKLCLEFLLYLAIHAEAFQCSSRTISSDVRYRTVLSILCAWETILEIFSSLCIRLALNTGASA